MRIKSISLSWFRGAAESVELATTGKSIVVYGENASGKSSFVDALEYLLNDGRIGHLAHEYSGKHQERGVRNALADATKQSGLKITFDDGGSVDVGIASSGKATINKSGSREFEGLTYRRTVLRQDEVSRFIHDTKGDKYSALLPLLGLQPLEFAAENLRQLSKHLDSLADQRAAREGHQQAETDRKNIFGNAADAEIVTRVEKLHEAYCPAKGTHPPVELCVQLLVELGNRLAGVEGEAETREALKTISNPALEGQLEHLRSSGEALAAIAEPLAAEKLRVLESAGALADKLTSQESLDCPACGRPVETAAFRGHVDKERARLQDGLTRLKEHRSQAGTFCTSVSPTKRALGHGDTKARLSAAAGVPMDASFEYLEQLDLDALRGSCGSDQLASIEEHVVAITKAARAGNQESPTELVQLLEDQRTITIAKKWLEVTESAKEVARTRVVATYVRSVEQAVRAEIKRQAQGVITDISGDIQRLWAILHPGEPIDNVHLSVPADTDKAIDIGLRFHGVAQDSPRLTLSEGCRNSLGLCVFLAVASRDVGNAGPIVLDDVVVSLDRNHRGMIGQLLEQEFKDRQVVLLTHDREWYTELRPQLDESRWLFKALQPYETPALGIRWSEKTWTFDEARSMLKVAPDSAGNTARKIMDIELALRAQRLKTRLPYLHREKNDHRTAHDFLAQICGDADRCFQIRAKDYEPFTKGKEALQQADRLLRSWGNSASHTFDVMKNEAQKLIDVCEDALQVFECPSCGKPVYKLDDAGAEILQCPCGQLRWRYGRA